MDVVAALEWTDAHSSNLQQLGCLGSQCTLKPRYSQAYFMNLNQPLRLLVWNRLLLRRIINQERNEKSGVLNVVPSGMWRQRFAGSYRLHNPQSSRQTGVPVWEDTGPLVNPIIHTYDTPTPSHYSSSATWTWRWRRYDTLETSLTNSKKGMVDILCTILKYNLVFGLVASHNKDDNLPW
jgi:hypothetical protein